MRYRLWALGLCSVLACGSSASVERDDASTADAPHDAAIDAAEDGPSCQTPIAALGGCIHSTELVVDAEEDIRATLALRGEVVAVGTGSQLELCGTTEPSDLRFGPDPTPPDARSTFLRLRDDDGREAVLLLWTDIGPVATVGERVGLDFRYFYPEFGPAQVTLTLRDEADGLIGWLGIGATLGELRPPAEISLTDEGAVCRIEDNCLAHIDRHDLTIAVQGASARLTGGERTAVGPYVAMHGGFDVYASQPDCADAAAGWVDVAALRTIPNAP